MKTIISETFDIVKDFYTMRKNSKSEYLLLIVVPILIGILAFLIGTKTGRTWEITILSFMVDFINQIITVLALFISFSIAYLGMIITSGSKIIEDMREEDSKHYVLGNKPVKVFQSIHCMMTYTVLIEVIYLVLVISQKFIVYFLGNIELKIMLCFDVVLLIHIIFLIGIQIRDIYFAFWIDKKKNTRT